jgi:hypothetical protein
MSIETALSREARANRHGSSSSPGPSHAPGMRSPAGTVGHRPNGTMIAGAVCDEEGSGSGGLVVLGRRVELVKEPVGGGLALTLGAPHDAALAVIACQRQT